MGVRVLYDPREERACLYDSVTGVVFGPLFEDPTGIREDFRYGNGDVVAGADDVAEAFLIHLRDDLGAEDARRLDTATLVNEYGRWRTVLADGS